MKKIIFLLFTCLTTLTFSQTKSFQINWKGVKTLSLETSDFQVPQFNKENFNFSSEKGYSLPVKSLSSLMMSKADCS